MTSTAYDDQHAPEPTPAEEEAWRELEARQSPVKDSLTAQQPVSGADGLTDSPTRGMNLGQRIAHVGGRENSQGYIEFGSPMAVDALIQHVLRDLTTSTPEGAFQARYRIPDGPWSSWGAVTCGVKGHEQELRYLTTEAQPQPSGNVGEVSANVIDALARMDALLDPASGLLTVPDMSATVVASRADLATIRAALAAQAETPVDDKAHPRFQAGYRAGMKDHLLNAKTDDQIGGLLEAIRSYGSWKYAEAKGRAEPDLSDVRAAWDEVYEKVQALAAQASGQDREDAERLKYILSKVCMIQAATYGCKFEILNLPPHFGDCEKNPIPPFLKAIDAARAAAKGEA